MFLIAGGVVAVLLVLRLLIGSSEEALGVEIDLDRMWGLWVALLAALGVGAGGFLKSKEPEPVASTAYGDGGYPRPPPAAPRPRRRPAARRSDVTRRSRRIRGPARAGLRRVMTPVTPP